MSKRVESQSVIRFFYLNYSVYWSFYPISPEKLAMKREEEAARKKLLESPEVTPEPTVIFPEIKKDELKPATS